MCHVLGYCSGLLLLFIEDCICVTNPLTKKFRFLNLPDPQRGIRQESKNKLGFAVNQIGPTTQSFKVVFIFEWTKTTDVTWYGFEIHAGSSLTCSETVLTCHTSNLDDRMKKPVYLDGSLHWLRNDGSIIAFNPETEQARLIQTDFPQGLLTWSTLFAPGGNNSLTLVSSQEDVIYVYALENILSNPKWVLVNQIRNRGIDKNRADWFVEAYNGKCLVLRSCSEPCDLVVHVYDLGANKWDVMGSVPGWCDANQNFFLFTPSTYSVVGLDEVLAFGDTRISSLRSIMTMVGGSSPENQLTKKKKSELTFGNVIHYTNQKKRIML